MKMILFVYHYVQHRVDIFKREGRERTPKSIPFALAKANEDGNTSNPKTFEGVIQMIGSLNQQKDSIPIEPGPSEFSVKVSVSVFNFLDEAKILTDSVKEFLEQFRCNEE